MDPVFRRGILAALLVASIAACTAWAQGQQDMDAGRTAFIKGHYIEAESLYKRSIATLEKASGPGAQALAFRLRSLAELYEIEARYNEAEPLMERVVSIDKQTNGAESLVYACDLHDLGRLSYLQGKNSVGEPLCRQGREILKKVSDKGDGQ